MKSNPVRQTLIIIFSLTTLYANAVITRHDVPSLQYEVEETPAFFVDMPFQGAAVLIDKQWLLAPAHVIYTHMYEYEKKPIEIHGVENQIEGFIIHPDYKRAGKSSSENHEYSLFEQLNKNKDIALIRLLHPVEHVKPIAIYGGTDEAGMRIIGFGRGAIGTGLIGEIEDSQGPSLITYSWYKITKLFSDWAFTQENYQLKKYSNEITDASNQWLRFTFEKGDKALPLEGTIGSGDSGGAVVVMLDNSPVLIGVAAWREFEGDVKTYNFGRYGATAVLTRVSYFNDWISNHVESVTVYSL